MINAIAGLLTGVLSGLGVGGGTLLMVYMITFAGIDQMTARGINLLYFIPASGGSLYFHIKNRFVDFRAAIPAIICGLLSTALSAYAATLLDEELLRRLFGLFLIVVGVREVFKMS